MVNRHTFALIILIFFFWSCASIQPPPPKLLISDLPAGETTGLNLDDRILLEDAWSYLQQGDTRRASRLLNKLGPSHPFYYAGMGYVAYILNDMTQAEETFKTALRINPDSILGHLGLSQVYRDSGRPDLAFSEYREVLKRDPDHPWVTPRYETLRAQKTGDLLSQGRAFYTSGDKEASKKSFLMALYYSPESLDAHWNLARIFMDENNTRSALLHLKTAFASDPENRDLRTRYADLLFKTEDYKKSLELYEDLLEKWPDDSEYKSRLETIKNRLGIFELPSQYNVIISSETITNQETAALVAVKFKSIITERIQKPPIIIDIATSWAQKYIIQTTALGILPVYPNHEFRPQKTIHRAEMAETLIRLIDYLKLKGYGFIQHIAPDRIRIQDVGPDNLFYRPITQILAYDIMSLESDQRFLPNDPVSGRDAIRYMDIILALIQ
ncbi:MAG: tetratricopeptide repeat protein [Acidobacteria bacterium]|nr:tetratricopeptide repeat protein [Acidobacteriota bacterium]